MVYWFYDISMQDKMNNKALQGWVSQLSYAEAVIYIDWKPPKQLKCVYTQHKSIIYITVTENSTFSSGFVRHLTELTLSFVNIYAKLHPL